MRLVFPVWPLLLHVVALRTHENFEETLTTVKIDDCDSSCEPRDDARHAGEFILKSGSGMGGISGISGHVSDYYVSSGKRGDGPGIQNVNVVPDLNQEDPVNKSSLLISVEPRELDAKQKAGSELHLCAVMASNKDQCLCRLHLAPERSNGRILRLLQPAIPLTAKRREEIEAKLLRLPYECPDWFPIDVPVLVLIGLFLALLLSVAHTLYSLYSLRKLSYDDDAVPSEMPEDKDRLPAMQLPSPMMDLKTGAMQSLRLTTLMTSLQAVVLRKIRTDADSLVVLCVTLWPCVFGFVGLWRSFRSMCQLQLAHAMLARGVCPTQPANARVYDLFMVVGTVLLAICVALALANDGFYTVCALIFGLFLGPSLSILGELQKASVQDSALSETVGTYRLKGLLRLFRREPSEIPMVDLDSKLLEGKVKMVPFSVLVSAGRSSSMDWQELEEADLGGEEDAEGIAFNLFLDLRWHSRALFQMTRSYAGFFILPLIFSAGAVLLASSTFQAGNYLCSMADLKDLSRANGGINFHPWIREYEVKLDASFAEAFLVATAEDTSTVLPLNSDDPDLEVKNTIHGTVQLTNSPLPRVTNVDVKGLRQRTAKYSILFTPIATLPSSLLISHGSFKRCVPWGEIPGSVITLPPYLKNADLNIEIALTDYVVSVPHACGSKGNSKTVHTEFCPSSNGSSGEAVCQTKCKHDPQCLASFAAKNGCYKAERRLSRDSRNCDDFDKKEIHDRHWLRREHKEINLTGRLCLSVAREATCVTADVNDRWGFRFKNVRLQWLNELADLKLALALAVGDQQFNSNEETLQFRLGEPQVLTVLANVVGDTWDGQQVAINATGIVQDDGVVGVTLSPYQPQRFRNMTMTMAVLLPDSNFQTSWIAVDNKVDQASGMFNSQCSESAFLGARFQICGNHWGWGAQINQVYLEPWTPGERSIFFQIHDKDDKERSHQTKVHEVKVQFEDGSSPAFWAIPAIAQDPKERCEFPTVSAGGLPDFEDFRTAGKEAMVALGASPPALCKFISRGCANVTMVGPSQSTVMEIGDTLFLGILETKSAGSRVDHCSSKIAPVLRCFRQAAGKVPWAWGQDRAWQVAADERAVYFRGRVSADVLWIKGLYSHDPLALPLKVEDLVKIVSPNASEVDEGLVRDACSFILSNSNTEMRATIMATLAGAAFKTNNPLAVRLVGKECFNYSQISRSQEVHKVVSLAWDSAKENSNGLEIVNETLRWENADFAESMLQFAMIDECAGCADVLQELLHVTGLNWSSLVFKKLTLYLAQNTVAFLRINATVPWICVDELVVENGQKEIGPLFVFGLQNFLQQVSMCTPPISALDMRAPLTAEGLGQLIGLETKLPKTLGLRLEFDGVPMFLQRLPLLPQLENLETLKLSLVKMDDARTSTFCDKVIQQPSTKLKAIIFEGGSGRQIHTEGMIAISKMVAVLPELERLDVSYNHIGDAGFEAFSEAMAPVASKSKLRFISVAGQSGNLGNLGVQALGKTLALLPALEEVVIEDNENITDEGLVAFLSPFLNKSLCSLRKIDIGWTNVSDAGVAVLAKLMEKHPLEEISISSTRITDEGLRLLGHALQNTTCLLKRVYAGQYRKNKAWSDEGVRDLLQGLEHCPNLVSVNVAGPKLSNETIQKASEALSDWQNLTSLYVTYGDGRYNLKDKNPLL